MLVGVLSIHKLVPSLVKFLLHKALQVVDVHARVVDEWSQEDFQPILDEELDLLLVWKFKLVSAILLHGSGVVQAGHIALVLLGDVERNVVDSAAHASLPHVSVAILAEYGDTRAATLGI